MKTHETGEKCPVCGGPAALTTEWGWEDEQTCTAVLCCPVCRTKTGMQDDAVEMRNHQQRAGEDDADSEQAALDLIDATAWHNRMTAHASADMH